MQLDLKHLYAADETVSHAYHSDHPLEEAQNQVKTITDAYKEDGKPGILPTPNKIDRALSTLDTIAEETGLTYAEMLGKPDMDEHSAVAELETHTKNACARGAKATVDQAAKGIDVNYHKASSQTVEGFYADAISTTQTFSERAGLWEGQKSTADLEAKFAPAKADAHKNLSNSVMNAPTSVTASYGVQVISEARENLSATGGDEARMKTLNQGFDTQKARQRKVLDYSHD